MKRNPLSRALAGLALTAVPLLAAQCATPGNVMNGPPACPHHTQWDGLTNRCEPKPAPTDNPNSI